jgi:NTE family protein
MDSGDLSAHRDAKRVILALGGGAARGLAHIGVLRGLEEDGVDIAGVAGTSMGSIVGAMVAQGLRADEIQGIFEEIDWPTLGRIMLRSVVGTAFHDLLRETLGRGTIENLRIPYAAVCCDLETGDRVVLRSGPIADAARASSSIPGIISPLQHDGRALVDGVVVDPVPITAAEELGFDPVLAVNVLRPPGPGDGLPSLREPRRGGGVPSAVFDRLDRWLRSHRDGEDHGDPGRHSRWEVVMRSFHIMAYRLASTGCPPAAMIEPEVGRFAWFDFPRAPDIIEQGYHAYRGWRTERPNDDQ